MRMLSSVSAVHQKSEFINDQKIGVQALGRRGVFRGYRGRDGVEAERLR